MPNIRNEQTRKKAIRTGRTSVKRDYQILIIENSRHCYILCIAENVTPGKTELIFERFGKQCVVRKVKTEQKMLIVENPFISI